MTFEDLTEKEFQQKMERTFREYGHEELLMGDRENPTRILPTFVNNPQLKTFLTKNRYRKHKRHVEYVAIAFSLIESRNGWFTKYRLWKKCKALAGPFTWHQVVDELESLNLVIVSRPKTKVINAPQTITIGDIASVLQWCRNVGTDENGVKTITDPDDALRFLRIGEIRSVLLLMNGTVPVNMRGLKALDWLVLNAPPGYHV